MRRFALVLMLFSLFFPSFLAAQPDAGVRPVDQHDRAEVRFGQVTVDVLWGSGIAVALDEHPADGTVDRLYVLQKAAHAPEELPLRFAEARVLYHESSVVVTGAPGEPGVALLLEGSERLPRQLDLMAGELETVRGKRAPAGTITELQPPHVYTGFGLHERTGELPADPFETLASEPGVVEKGSCSSGGVGSTACSLTCGSSSCSTSCASDYYACCSCKLFGGANCECVYIGSGGNLGGPGGGGGGGGGDECVTNGYCPASCMTCSPYYSTEDETPGTAGS